MCHLGLCLCPAPGVCWMQTGRRSGRQAMQSCARSGLALAVCPAHGQRHLHRLTGTDRDPQQQAGRHSAASEHGRQPGLGFWPGQATPSVSRFPSPCPRCVVAHSELAAHSVSGPCAFLHPASPSRRCPSHGGDLWHCRRLQAQRCLLFSPCHPSPDAPPSGQLPPPLPPPHSFASSTMRELVT